jgi:hypothetical protein
MPESTYLSMWNENFSSPCAAAEGLAALCSSRTTWKPVRPERVTRSIVEITSKHQVEDMVAGRACPTCGCGLLGYGAVLCANCLEEIENETRDRKG